MDDFSNFIAILLILKINKKNGPGQSRYRSKFREKIKCQKRPGSQERNVNENA